MGWTLVSSAHGKGYATEALRAALAWVKRTCRGENRLHHLAGKPGFAGAGEKVGFSESRRSEYHQSPIVVMHCPL
ncbi:GNAT family N-acetyltransferase [Serratia ureilytica]